jgi:hypothetical protein
MRMKKCQIRLWTALFVLVAGLPLRSAVDDQQADPIVQFYCTQARSVCAEHRPDEQALTYSLTAISYLKKLDSHGAIKHVDSAIADFYFSGGTLDSQKTAVSTSNKLADIDFSYPNVFDQNYQFSFYPNDTGGKYLAIGFDTDSAGDPRPVGLAIIDRYEYSLHRLYLFYPHREDYKRFSKILHYTKHEGYIFPDSIIEVAAREGIFSTDHYHLETTISNIKINR